MSETAPASPELPEGLPPLPPVPDGFDRWHAERRDLVEADLSNPAIRLTNGKEWLPISRFLSFGFHNYRDTWIAEAVREAEPQAGAGNTGDVQTSMDARFINIPSPAKLAPCDHDECGPLECKQATPPVPDAGPMCPSCGKPAPGGLYGHNHGDEWSGHVVTLHCGCYHEEAEPAREGPTPEKGPVVCHGVTGSIDLTTEREMSPAERIELQRFEIELRDREIEGLIQRAEAAERDYKHACERLGRSRQYEADLTKALTETETKLEAAEAVRAPDPQPGAAEDDLADLVRRFSDALLAKLRAAEAKYGHNNAWLFPNWHADLCRHLREHVEKGDPRDVAAYCAFAWHHGWSVATPPAEEPGTPVCHFNEVAQRVRMGQTSWKDEWLILAQRAESAERRAVDAESAHKSDQRLLSAAITKLNANGIECGSKALVEAARRVRDLEAKADESKWFPIGTAPWEGAFLAFEPHAQGGFQFVACITTAGRLVDTLSGDAYPHATHWRPLPDYPEALAAKEARHE